jgi:hypothetical protein
MLLVRFCDAVEAVRERFAAAAPKAILRADSYSIAGAENTKSADRAAFKTPKDYLPGALPHDRTDLALLCEQLLNPESKHGELLKSFCDNSI